MKAWSEILSHMAAAPQLEGIEIVQIFHANRPHILDSKA